MKSANVTAVCRRARHNVSKDPHDVIRLLAGLGVEGDAHLGETVQHRSRKRWRPDLPNLRQVHLMGAELHDELRAQGFDVAPGRMGENVTTRGVDLLALPVGTRLRLGVDAVVELTGLRNPCNQLEALGTGLMEATLEHAPDGSLVRKAGVMAVVVEGGDVRAGDAIAIDVPPEPHGRLEPV
jgi:hypothetical protein